jgi:hypothetical protein
VSGGTSLSARREFGGLSKFPRAIARGPIEVNGAIMIRQPITRRFDSRPSQELLQQMEDVCAQFRGIIFPVAVDFPTNVAKIVTCIATHTLERLVASGQPIVRPLVRRRNRQPRRRLGVDYVSDWFESLCDLDAALDVGAPAAELSIHHNVVAVLAYPSRIYFRIHFVQ